MWLLAHARAAEMWLLPHGLLPTPAHYVIDDVIPAWVDIGWISS